MSMRDSNMAKKQAGWFSNMAQGSPLGAAVQGLGSWGKRKAFDFAPEHFGGKRGGEFGKQFGNLFGMGDQGQDLGRQAGRFGGNLYKGLPKGQQNAAYNTMNTVQPMMQQGLDSLTQFGGGWQNKASSDKQASIAAILAALGGGAVGGYGGTRGVLSLLRKMVRGQSPYGAGRAGAAMMAPGMLAGGAISGAGVGTLGGYGGAKVIEALLNKESAAVKTDLHRVRLAIEKRAFLGRALGGIGKGVGDILGGAGKLGWRGMMRGLGVGKGVAPTSALTKALTVGTGGLGLSAINEVLASTKGGPIQLPHFGMGGDQPWWDPMMQHDRMDPKKTGFKSLLNMGARPLQTIAALTGMSRKPGTLSDYARTTGEGSRLSDFVQDPKNFRIDPVTGRGIVTGEVPISLDPSIIERMQDFHKEKEFMERMGLVRGRGSSSSSSRRRRGRFD